MDALRCPPGDADVSTLSGGERRRVALCRLLLSKPDLLLLDEPTNHLDAESVAWLERTLQDYAGTVVAVTHDRYFLDNVAGWILELDRGAGIPWEGNYSSWLEQKQDRLAREQRADTSRQDALQRELEWIRMSPRARQSKGKARINAYNDLVAEAEAAERRADKLEIAIPAGPRLGDRVIDAEGLSKGYGDRLLIDDLSFLLPPGGIVGVIGPNGAGKTTLFRMMVGEETPDAGTLEVGTTVELAYVDQSRDQLDPDATVYEEITGGVDHMVVGGREIHGRAYVASFGFTGSDQQKKVGQLSGGERNRVQLAKVLKAGGNVLLLDEPTNDLDIPTLEILEENLLDFPGALVLVTHDRYLLNRVASTVLGLDGRGHTGRFADYAQWEDWIEQQNEPGQAKQDRKADGSSSAQRTGGDSGPGGKKKLSYLEARELAAIEKRVEESDARLAAARDRVEDPGIASNAAALQEALLELDAAQHENDAFYARWAELTEKAG